LRPGALSRNGQITIRVRGTGPSAHGRLTFTIKGIGDYTRALPGLLRVGQAVTVEGPYGRFDFQGDRDRQIWVAGGVGITPFIARLQALPNEGRDLPIDLVYTTSLPDAAFIDNIRQLVNRAGAQLHLWLSQRDGRLTADKLCDLIPQWEAADVWFCGPSGLGNALRDGLIARGFPLRHFHRTIRYAMKIMQALGAGAGV
jgi:predicted ferric reductase